MASERIPGAQGRSGVALSLDDGTLARWQTPSPGGLGLRLADQAPADKLVAAMRRTIPLLPAELRAGFAVLLTSRNLALTTGVLAVWAGSHLFGVGEVADALLALTGAVFLGMSVFTAGHDLVQFVHLGSAARTPEDLDRAAVHLARFVATVGVATIVSLILKAGGRLRSPRLSGAVEGTPGTKWWEAADFGPDWAGTSIPRSFTLKIGKREFTIKANATEHMAERARTHGSVGARMGQVDFPLSSLAGALEQAELSGKLGPLLRGQVPRLGTKQMPFRVGEWELSLELVAGRIEVLHAVYRP